MCVSCSTCNSCRRIHQGKKYDDYILLQNTSRSSDSFQRWGHFIINHKYYNTSKTGRLENIMQKQLNSIEDYGSNVCKYAFGRSQKKHEALLFLSDKNSILMFKDKKQSNLSSKLFLP